MADNISVLLSEEQIKERVTALAGQIREDYQGKDLVIIGVLKGSFVFMADLMRHINLPLTVDFLAVSSYGRSTETTGAVKILKDLDMPIEGKDVLIVEDILDSGFTLRYIIDLLDAKKAASVKTCVLLDKPSRRLVPLTADYRGFTIEDEFVVGYGLDYAQNFRWLPYIGVITL